MKLRQLTIERLPGITEPFTLDVGDAGFQVITGPNGIGKSSLCRATRALLWPGLGPSTGVTVSARFQDDTDTWTVERDGTRLEWQRNGQPESPPPLPASHLERCFVLALPDLLDRKGGDGADVAGAIRRQMAGGFDLDQAAVQAFGAVKPNLGKTESRKVTAAQKELTLATRQQAALAEQEARLEQLQQQRDEAAASGRRLAAVEDAQGLAQARLRHQEWQVQADALADADVLANMTGREAEELQEKDRQLEQLRQRQETVLEDLKEAQHLREECRLTEPVPAEQLGAARRRAEALDNLEHSLQRDRVELAEKEKVLRESALPLGDRARPGQEARLVDRDAVFRYLGQAESLRLQEAALQQRIQLLRKVDPDAPEAALTERLRQAVDCLREWLRAATPGSAEALPQRRPTGAILLVVLGILLVAAELTGLVTGSGWLILGGVLAGSGLGALWTLRFKGPATTQDEPRTSAAQRFSRLELEAPSAWTATDVDRRLQELESQLTEDLAKERRIYSRGVEATELESQQAGLADAWKRLRAQHAALFESLGVDPDTLTAPSVDLLTSLSAWRRRREARDTVQARVEQQTRTHAQELQDLASFLEAHGVATPSHAAEVLTGLDELGRRVQQLHSAGEQERKALRDQDHVKEEWQKARQARTDLFVRCGLKDEDRAGLHRRLEDHRSHRELEEQERELGAGIRQFEARLEQAGAAELGDQTQDSLQSLHASLSAQAGRLQDLHEQCATIQAQVRQAREGHDLEDRLAAREAARDELAQRRDEALVAQAGRFLLERVRARHEQTQVPRVLQRARDLFSGFTHHEYELQVSTGADGGLRALETRTKKGRSPAQLSDGTRAQLLLAARLAFAEEADRGEGLPLFLDEALDQSDPQRAHAIIRALGRLVADTGRQVFYLTSDRKDAERIQLALRDEGVPAAHLQDLAEVRGHTHRVQAEEELRVPPLAAPEPVEGHTAESYGVALGVPRLAPERGGADQHLLHLVWDDLVLLRRMLEVGVTRVGPWRRLQTANHRLAAKVCGDNPLASQLDARARLLDRFCDLWQRGRGRPADRTVLEQSGAVSPTYLDRVAEYLAECEGNAAQLVAALRAKSDERLAGFRSNKTDDLEQHLEAQGHLDPRPVLDQVGLHERILATPVAAELPTEVVARCIDRWWRLAGDSDQASAASPSA